MKYLKVLNDILILNEPETPLKCRKLVLSGWDRFLSKWAEELTTKLCREKDSAFWIRVIFFSYFCLIGILQNSSKSTFIF